MGRIQSNIGLVTGLPIQDTVNQLMQLNALSRNRLAARNATLGREQTAIASLTSLVIAVQLTTDRLGQASLFHATRVTSSSDTISARSVGNPQVGSYSFTPIRQAQSQQLTSGLFASADQKLGEGSVTIHTGGFLDQTVALDKLNDGAGVARGWIRITDRSGTSRDIDLRFAQTAADVVHAINSADSLAVVASTVGGRFVLNDVSGSVTHNLSVQEVGSGSTARDLGLAGISTAQQEATGAIVLSLSHNTRLADLLDARGLELPTTGASLRFSFSDGTQFDYATDLDSKQATLGQLLSDIQTAGNGKLLARISSDGKSIVFEDLTSGSADFGVSSPSGNLAQQLGVTGSADAGVITSQQLQSGLSDTLLSSLNGGKGLGHWERLRSPTARAAAIP
jgi:flagellar hook-associated protein 2